MEKKENDEMNRDVWIFCFCSFCSIVFLFIFF